MSEFIELPKNNNKDDYFNTDYEIIPYNNTGYYPYNDDYTNFFFMCIYFLSILFIIRCTCYYYIKCRYYYQNKSEQITLNTTPRFNYTKLDNGINIDDNCSICLEKINKKSIKLNCNHIFHKKCITLWIKETNNNPDLEITCPLCKINIV